MHTEMVLRHLDQYSEKEIFYQTYQNLKRNPERFSAFISSLDPCVVGEKQLVLPEFPDAMEKAGISQTGDGCPNIDMDRTIYLAKHDRCAPPFLHTHSFFELIYVLRGSCTHTVFGKDTLLGEGDLCFLAPHLAHAVYVDESGLVLKILLHKESAEAIFCNILRESNQISDFMRNSLYTKRSATYLVFHTKGDRAVCGQILEMYKEQQFCKDAYSSRILTSMLVIFFGRLMRHYDQAAYMPPQPSQRPDAAPFLAYILKDYRTITLSSLARQMNYSVPYCSRHIKDVTGYTFSQLLQQIRFQKAEQFLRSSTLSIQRIASDLGYENPENFIRAFKKSYGVSPARYRAQFGAQEEHPDPEKQEVLFYAQRASRN